MAAVRQPLALKILWRHDKGQCLPKVVEKGFTGGGRQCWGLVLKYYELRTRQHKMLNVNAFHPTKHYFP
jgi:hypothetical protein